MKSFLFISFIVICSYQNIATAQLWKQITPSFETPEPGINMLAGTMVNRNTGWVCSGTSGIIYRTDDGGNRWLTQRQVFSPGWPLRVYATDTSHVWVLGVKLKTDINDINLYYLLLTKDGGKSWNSSFIAKTTYEFSDLFFFSGSEGFTFNNHPWLTTDGCQSWTTTDTAIFFTGIQETKFINRNLGWVVGSSNPFALHNGFIARTTDGGNSFEYQGGIKNGPQPPILFGLDFINDSTGFAVGNNRFFADGFLMKTLDSGRTWIRTTMPSTGKLADIEFIDSKRGWICGAMGRIWSTTDGGTSWSSDSTPTQYQLYKIIALKSENIVYVLGDYGTILFKDLNITDVKDKHLNKQEVTINLYPNPCTDVINFEYKFDAEPTIRIHIKDVYGRSVMSIFKDDLRNGKKYTQVFRLAELKNGMYLLTVNTLSGTMARKIIKM